MSKYLQLTITDTLSFWNNYVEDYIFNPDNKSSFTSWYKLPESWLESNKLKADKLEIILKKLYGENWRAGNGDGSRSQILEINENILSDEQALRKPWLTEKEICYAVSEDDSIKKCEPNEF